MLYSCFAGVGKSHLAKIDNLYIDLESSDFQWVYPDDLSLSVEERKSTKNKRRNSQFPINYINAMKDYLKQGKRVLISSQPEVLDLVKKYDLPLTTVSLDPKLKDIYLKRYKERGNNEDFIDLMDKNFNNFCKDLISNDHASSIIIIKNPDMYLSDII